MAGEGREGEVFLAGAVPAETHRRVLSPPWVPSRSFVFGVHRHPFFVCLLMLMFKSRTCWRRGRRGGRSLSVANKCVVRSSWRSLYHGAVGVEYYVREVLLKAGLSFPSLVQ